MSTADVNLQIVKIRQDVCMLNVHICISLYRNTQKSIHISKNSPTLLSHPPEMQGHRPSPSLSHLTCMENHDLLLYPWPNNMYVLTAFSSKNIWHISVLEMPKSSHCWQKKTLSLVIHTFCLEARHLLHNSDPFMEYLQGHANYILVSRFYKKWYETGNWDGNLIVLCLVWPTACEIYLWCFLIEFNDLSR
jgi:hypothetical protein